MKLYYVVNARMPSHKAYGIQIAKMCEAFVESGIEIELLIPRTRQSHISLREFYNLRVDVPTRVFAGLDWYDKGSIAFALCSLVFMTRVCLYIFMRRNSAFIYSIDMDPYSYSPLALLGLPLTVEMHSPKSSNIFTRLFFKRANRIITTNPLIKEKLASVFNIKPESFIVEPNGVDELTFDAPSKEDARKELKLSADAKIVLYVGRFYDWKGMQILQQASQELAEKGISIYLVGGTKEEFEATTKKPSSPLYFGGSAEHKDIAKWCSAADVLLVLGTSSNEFSYRYTAPMKLFEYLASGRPVVAVDTPAIRSLVSESEVEFYVPDDSVDLAHKILSVFSNPEKSKQAVVKGLQRAREHTWARRAERIIAFSQSPSIPKT